MLKKALLIFLLIVVLLFLLVIGGTYYLLGTENGFSWTSAKLQNVDDRLTLAPVTGNLSEGVSTDSVIWNDQNLSVQATGIDSKWSSACLLKTSFCLQHLNIEEVRVQTNTSDDKAAAPREDPIELPAFALPFRFESELISIKRLLIENDSGSEPLVLEDIKLKADANGSTVNIDSLSAVFKNYDLQLSGDLELSDEYPITANLTLNANNVIDDHDFTVAAALSNTLRNLKVNGNIGGAASIIFNADLQPLEPSLPARMNITWQSLGWPLDTSELIKATEGRLIVAGSMDDYAIRLSSDILGQQIPATSLKLNGQVNTKRALIPQIDLFLLDGFATGSFAANWTNGTNWIGELIFKEINPGSHWEDMPGHLNGLVTTAGSAADGQWAMKIDKATVDGTLRQFPFTLDAIAARSVDNKWIIPALTLEDGPNVLNVSGEIGEEVQLDVLLDFPALHVLLPNMAGDLTAEAKVSGLLTKPSLNLHASSGLIKLGNALLRDLKVDANILEAGEAQSQLDVGIDSVTANAQEVNAITASLKGARLKHQLKARANGPQKTRVVLNTDGTLTEQFDWNGLLKSMTIQVPSHQLSLASPTKIDWSNSTKRLLLAPHCWLSSGATLCLENAVSSDKKGKAEVTIKGYTLAQLNDFLPAGTQLKGELGARSNLSWDTDNPDAFTAQLDAKIAKGEIVVPDATNSLKFNYDSITLSTNADPYTITADLNLASKKMGSGKASFTLNPKSATKDILGEVKLDGFDLSFLQSFLPDYETIAGKVSAQGEITGSLSDPQFNGNVSLNNPIVKSDELPLAIEGGVIKADIDGTNAQLSGSLQSGKGEIGIDGKAKWGEEKWSATLNLDGKQLVIIQKPIIYSEVYPAIKIDLAPNRVEVRGRVTIPTAEINIKDRAQGGATLSEDVVIIEEEAAKAAEPATEAKSQMAVSTKIDVYLGNDVNLSGYGLQAKLSGEINVLKNDQDPTQLGGEIRVVEGFYKSYGQDLNIKDGQILFVGPIEQTTLNIDAVRDIENEERVAGLHLEGQIADPSVTLFTEPADKSQESILSYIVLGRDLGATSQGESNLLAQAALALTLRQGRGFATGFAESLGISDFSIDASGRGDDTQVVISGRLSRKLLLRYGRSVFVPEETLFLRYDISKRLYLEAANGVEQAVDLFYSFSF